MYISSNAVEDAYISIHVLAARQGQRATQSQHGLQQRGNQWQHCNQATCLGWLERTVEEKTLQIFCNRSVGIDLLPTIDPFIHFWAHGWNATSHQPQHRAMPHFIFLPQPTLSRSAPNSQSRWLITIYFVYADWAATYVHWNAHGLVFPNSILYYYGLQ